MRKRGLQLNKRLVLWLVCGFTVVLALSFSKANDQKITEGVITISKPGNPAALSLAAGANEVISPIQRAAPFTALIVRWDAPQDSTARIFVRFLHERWSEWVAVEADEDSRDDRLVVAESRVIPVKATDSFQYKITFGSPRDRDTLSSISFHYVNASAGPRATVRIAVSDDDLPIVSRAAWGADESYRLNAEGAPAWEEEYYTPKRIVIHHTGGVDANKNPAATVRSIYYWHAISRGWGDIGYNYLIDSNGTIYEGRRGGEGVVGGHTYLKNRNSIGIALLGCYEIGSETTETSSCGKLDPLTPAMEDSLAKLIATKAREFNIDPLGSSSIAGVSYPNVAGHRDLGHTLCPGSSLYARLPALRTKILEFAQKIERPSEGTLAASFVRVSTDAPRIPANRTGEVIVEFKNTGTVTWRGYEDDFVYVADAAEKKKLSALGTVRIAAAADASPTAATAKLLGGNVYPGQTGRFKITLAPRKDEERRSFILAWKNKGYFPDTDFTLAVYRTAAVADDVGGFSAQLERVSVPALAGVNDRLTGSVRFVNTSALALAPAEVRLRITLDGISAAPFRVPDWRDEWASIAPEETSIPPGGLMSFAFPAQAPSVAGSYTLTYDLMRGESLLAQAVQTIAVGEHNAATVVSHTLPTAVVDTWRQQVTIRVKNAGVESWQGLALTTGTPKYAYNRFIDKTWKHKSKLLTLKDAIEPGQEVELTFYLDAAYLNGTYAHWYSLATGDATLLSVNGKPRLEVQTKVTRAKKK